MKLLIHSNGPNANTGYGVQTALLARRLRDAGHEVAVSCTYGVQAGGRLWEGIQLYPAGYEQQSNDVIHNHALHWFGGDPLGGWIIVLTDVWAMRNPLLADFNVIGWAPVDHYPVPPGVLAFFEMSGALPVAMSRYGVKCFAEMGHDADYIPLALDPGYKPTPTLEIGGSEVTCRELLGVDEDAFVVGMTAMNKDPFDRKGFNEALRAFGEFWRRHNEAVLYLHTDKNGMGTGLDLATLATHAAVPVHAVKFTDTYALLNGFSTEMMSALYTAFDVLLAPSHGEGFCVPLIEAQACGTPVIVTDFSAQPELVAAGWTVAGQPQWDAAQKASYITPFIPDIVDKLEDAYQADRARIAAGAVEFALQYAADRVFDNYWVPFLATLEETDPLVLDREPIGEVAVIVPAMRRPHNVTPLVESLKATPEATAYFVCDPDDHAEIEAVKNAGANVIISDRGHTYPIKANVGYEHTSEPWIFLCGDDVEFTPGWLDAARPLSDRFDVIGTNDAADGHGNRLVQDGKHADHFLVRRSYIDTYGASLDGPGVLCCEEYNHFFVDYELVKLARARGVFAPCLTSVVIHNHPGLGRGLADLVYQQVDSPESVEDKRTFEDRQPLIAMQVRGRGKPR